MLGVRIAYLLMITRVIQFLVKRIELCFDFLRDIIRQRKAQVIVGRVTTLASAVSPSNNAAAPSLVNPFYGQRIGA